MSLREYARKRRFDATPEPAEDAGPRAGGRPGFVIQLHHARARHYDFRLEVDGALKSWAVPKGPSLRAGEKRLAVEVEDHPLSYAGFSGEIPKGQYGAGHVAIFDRGVWSSEGDPAEAIAAGSLDFALEGERLRGRWRLLRTGMRGSKPQWLLIKRRDEHVCDADADSLVEASGASVDALATGGRGRVAGARNVATTRSRAGSRPQAKASGEPKRGTAAATDHPRAPGRAGRDRTWRRRALAAAGAVVGEVPEDFALQLATLHAAAPRGEKWLHEVKWDGYRMRAALDDGTVRLLSRNGQDWSPDFPEISQALSALPVASARLDGELVALDEQGRSDFSALQRTLSGEALTPLRYLLFDLPALAGVDLRQVALLQRKALLEALLEDPAPALAFSQHIVGHGPEVFAASGRQGLEGIISKRVDAVYDGRRSQAWVKVKHARAEEFLVIGYTAPKGSRQGLGSLLLATVEDGDLRYVGRVGTGFDDATLKALAARLSPIRQDAPVLQLPAHAPVRADSVHWVQPVLVAEVNFRDWSRHRQLRHASFARLREDKTVADMGLEQTPSAGRPEVRLTHPERLVYPALKLSKGDVADYYRTVADRLLPELAGRPVSLLRCPGGIDAPCFFQKHHSPALGGQVGTVDIREKDGGTAQYVCIDSIEAVLELVQMNTIEFHPWGARSDDPERPDRLVFDLDPGPGIGWKQIVAAARDIRDRLQEAGLQSFVRLSGGKGLHVVVPIRRGPSWDQAKGFCAAFAEAMVAHRPATYVDTASKAKRRDRIFIDWLRNGRGATSVCNWSLRARASAGVAMPLRWNELGRIRQPDVYDLPRALRRASSLAEDPWAGIDTLDQSLPEFS